MREKAKMKIVGILGGMGPYGTVMFFKNILDLTPVKKDWDHLRIIIDNNPHIPSPSRAIMCNEESPVNGIMQSCKRLASYPVDFIVLPSNSACYFLPDVQKHIKTPILKTIDITSEATHSKFPHLKKVSVLGGMVTYLKQTYKDRLKKRGIEYIQHTEKLQNTIVDLVDRIKIGEKRIVLEELFMSIAGELQNNGAEGIILACTELTLFREFDISMPIVDSSCVLSEYTVQIALGQKPIPLDTGEIYNFWKQRAQMLVEGKVSRPQSTLFVSDTESAEERDMFEKKKLFEIISRFNRNCKGIAIEYGCGAGRIAEALAKYFDSIDGVDYCEEFIKIAKKNAIDRGITNINYCVSRIEDFVPKRNYDYAICAGILTYLSDDQFSKVVKQIAYYLNLGGRCIIREPMGFLKRFELHGFFSQALNSVYNAVYRSSDEIINEFTKYGFDLKHEEITLPPTPDKPETCQKILVLEKQRQ